ncbi:ATPase [Citromicrobium sp. JL31]|nr:DnaA/Hda family protein [Citromicrobium sp. JL477]ALG62015.1 ATPase [Citromicrobium sp. JL477]KPM16251.1 ATPase [Citromicrobium sp. JL1351]KPM19287.1 ATPase [Citromicrobium sp. JL31]KPM23891.1 ATPase [Citromicrobium sp. JL2201]
MSRPSSQFALPLPPAQEGDPASIVIGSANLAVVEALREPERWPFRTAILRGESRSGKSLLGRWFAHAGLGETIDPADAMEETALFHRWNRAQEEGTALLLIPEKAPWEIALPDLRSRLGAALALEIGQPDDDMMRDLIVSHAARRGLMLGEDALTYVVPRMTRSFAAAERFVAVLDRLALERQARPTRNLCRDALETLYGPDQGRLL